MAGFQHPRLSCCGFKCYSGDHVRKKNTMTKTDWLGSTVVRWWWWWWWWWWWCFIRRVQFSKQHPLLCWDPSISTGKCIQMPTNSAANCLSQCGMAGTFTRRTPQPECRLDSPKLNETWNRCTMVETSIFSIVHTFKTPMQVVSPKFKSVNQILGCKKSQSGQFRIAEWPEIVWSTTL